MILSEHWGRKKKSFNAALAMEHFKAVESSRGILAIPTRGRNGSRTFSTTGGGVAIVYNEENFAVEEPAIIVPEGVEAAWIILTPRSTEISSVKKILIGGIYIAPRSIHKQTTIEHIIETMHYVQSQYEEPICFLIGGDFNKVCIDDILESNGALHQVCSVATRNAATLELVITCMATLLHPPTTKDPFLQDPQSKGKPSDHNVIIVAPRTDIIFRVERQKKTIQMRPLPESKVADFMRELGSKHWSELYTDNEAHAKAQHFHDKILELQEKHLPMKSVKMSSLDKNWFNPSVKLKYNNMQKEFFKNKKSEKWKKLRSQFKSAKRKASKEFYQQFVNDLKVSKPSMYHKMAKRIGGIDKSERGNLKIECLEGLSPQEQVQRVANSFAKVSNQFKPVDKNHLPAFLPAQEVPQLQIHQVYEKIQNQKKTKSTLETDLPHRIRKEAALFLAEPLTIVLNESLKQGKFPKIWKQFLKKLIKTKH